MPKLLNRTLPILVLLLVAGATRANAQVSVYFGMGTATNSAATLGGCPPKQVPDAVDPTICDPAPTMGGVFGVLGGDYMIKPHLGVSFEYAFRFAQASYLPLDGLNVRPGFYDFNAVYQPTKSDSHIVPVIEGGIGGARLSLYFNQQTCVTSICSNFNQVIATANHFQLHGGFGVKFYVKSDMFIKPQIDLHWVPNLNQQYGRNFVPRYTVSIGYTFGRQ